MLSIILGLAVVAMLVIIAGLLLILDDERRAHARHQLALLEVARAALRSGNRLTDAGHAARATLLATIREAGSGR